MVSKWLFISIILFSGCHTRCAVGIEFLSSGEQRSVKKEKISDGVNYYSIKITDQTVEYSLYSRLISVERATTISEMLRAHVSDDASNKIEVHIKKAKSVDGNERVFGYRVVVHGFDNGESASTFHNRLGELTEYFEVISRSSFEGEDANLNISILEIFPSKFRGTAEVALALSQVQGTTSVSEMVRATGSIAGINGGFFSYDSELSVVGDLAGITVINGDLASEAVQNRPALLIRNLPELSFEVLTNVKTEVSISNGEMMAVINGINRMPGKIFNCGYVDNESFIAPSHDEVCENNNEIILLNDKFGGLPAYIPNDISIHFIDAEGSLFSIANRNSLSRNIPNGAYIVLSTGTKRSVIQGFSNSAGPISVSSSVVANNKEVQIDTGAYIVNGGPTLLKGGKFQNHMWEYEGWSPKNNSNGKLAQHEKDKISAGASKSYRAAFYDGWINRRHPRTGVGISKNGTTYFVVVYGRNSLSSAGASISELAQLFLSLGVSDAINLDGGGSSVMVLDGLLTGVPSDSDGERPVGDALLIIPNK